MIVVDGGVAAGSNVVVETLLVELKYQIAKPTIARTTRAITAYAAVESDCGDATTTSGSLSLMIMIFSWVI